jgi:hypothetical protein
MIDTANKGGNPMASPFKKTVSTFSMRNLREGGLFPLAEVSSTSYPPLWLGSAWCSNWSA